MVMASLFNPFQRFRLSHRWIEQPSVLEVAPEERPFPKWSRSKAKLPSCFWQKAELSWSAAWSLELPGASWGRGGVATTCRAGEIGQCWGSLFISWGITRWTLFNYSHLDGLYFMSKRSWPTARLILVRPRVGLWEKDIFQILSEWETWQLRTVFVGFRWGNLGPKAWAPASRMLLKPSSLWAIRRYFGVGTMSQQRLRGQNTSKNQKSGPREWRESSWKCHELINQIWFWCYLLSTNFKGPRSAFRKLGPSCRAFRLRQAWKFLKLNATSKDSAMFLLFLFPERWHVYACVEWDELLPHQQPELPLARGPIQTSSPVPRKRWEKPRGKPWLQH